MSTKKLCFVVSQIGEENSPERVSADWFLEAIVQPVFERSFPEFEVRRADGIAEPGMIDAQVISSIIMSELVIADLTNMNPNVFYEIGLRHMTQKPIIHMHEVGTKIPFDVSLYRSIRYSRVRPRDIASAATDLAGTVTAVLETEHQVENPVSRALGKLDFKQHASSREQVLAGELEALRSRMTELEHLLVPRAVSSKRLREAMRPFRSIAVADEVHQVPMLRFTTNSPHVSTAQLHHRVEAGLERLGVNHVLGRASEDRIDVLIQNLSPELRADLASLPEMKDIIIETLDS
jgi:hypothetical protein